MKFKTFENILYRVVVRIIELSWCEDYRVVVVRGLSLLHSFTRLSSNVSHQEEQNQEVHLSY